MAPPHPASAMAAAARATTPRTKLISQLQTHDGIPIVVDRQAEAGPKPELRSGSRRGVLPSSRLRIGFHRGKAAFGKIAADRLHEPQRRATAANIGGSGDAGDYGRQR